MRPAPCLARSHTSARLTCTVAPGLLSPISQMEKGGDVTHSRSLGKYAEEPSCLAPGNSDVSLTI